MGLLTGGLICSSWKLAEHPHRPHLDPPGDPLEHRNLASLRSPTNIITLGGLSLAIGLDDATVTIENIHRNAQFQKTFVEAILDGAKQIAAPAFTVMMCICIVFASVAVLEGASYFLFIPFALSVVSSVAMRSRPLPHPGTGAGPSLPPEELEHHDLPPERRASSKGSTFALTRGSRCSNGPTWVCSCPVCGGLSWSLPGSGPSSSYPWGCSSLSVGTSSLPSTPASSASMSVAGTRLELTESIFSKVEEEIRQVIPAAEIKLMLDNIGLPADSTAMAFSDTTTLDTSDGEILAPLQHTRSTRRPSIWECCGSIWPGNSPTWSSSNT